MVTAVASTASPTIWPPTRRVESGNDADTSLTWSGTGAGVGSGVGETCGKATLGSVTAPGSWGSPADESSPGGNPPGSVTPRPIGSVAGVVAGVEAAATVTLPDSDAEAADCAEVPVAVRVMWVPAALPGTTTAARSCTAWPAVRPTEHVVPPGAEQIVKRGDSSPGFAAILIFALPFTLPASQTQIAYRACPPSLTLAASGWTVMHRWSEADGDVVEGLGLGLVLEGLGLGLVLVALGVGLGEVVVGDGVAEALEDALALGVGDALADALAEVLEDAPTLGVGVALALLTDTAVSWAAHGLAAACAGIALPISKIPVSPARKIKNPETMPNARVVARHLRMGYALATVIPVRVALVAMVSPVNAGSIPRSSHSTPGRLIKGSARAKGI
jgi:hypothetical protein